MITFAITASQCTGMAGYGCALRVGDRIHSGAEPARDPAAELQRLCAEAGIEAGAIDEVRLDRGPGSYVGLRVAVTTAAFLRRFGGARVLLATSLELMAASALASGLEAGGGIRPILDGRRRRYHTGLLEASRGRLRSIEDSEAVTAGDLLERIREGQLLLAASPLHEIVAPRAQRAGALVRVPEPVSAQTLLDDSLPFRDAGEQDLEPLYLMPSYAE